MSLRAFHVLFISASVLLALGLGWWCLPEHKVAAGVAAAVAVLLVGYESWFLRKMRSLP
jgi:phosphotransferase system  glucose/maltose/N-acetylglucosamine-specific IIC component